MRAYWQPLNHSLRACEACGGTAEHRHSVETPPRMVEGIAVIFTKSIYRCTSCAPAATRKVRDAH